jgi:hypothetical protein
MPLDEKLLKKLSQTFEPNTVVNFKFQKLDAAVQTDEDGHAVRLFLGKLAEDGMVHGERYTRVIVKDQQGTVVKDHWDKKGKAGS